jgi:hypothetical protein
LLKYFFFTKFAIKDIIANASNGKNISGENNKLRFKSLSLSNALLKPLKILTEIIIGAASPNRVARKKFFNFMLNNTGSKFLIGNGIPGITLKLKK